MHAKLIIIGGKANREEIRLKLPTVVGRSRNAGVVISHPTISRQHCELYEQSGKVYVRDLGSLNGTLVDGDQVQGSCLEHGAKFTIGPLTFQMVYEHLGPLPAEPAADEDSAIGQAIVPPELAQTVVDLPRMAPVEVDFTQTAEVEATARAATDDDGFDLALPTEDEPSLGLTESLETLPPAPLETEPLKLFDSDEEDFLPAPVEASSDNAMAPEIDLGPPGEVDELGFDLSEPEPELAPVEEPVAEAAALAEEPPSPTTEAEDDFLSMIEEEAAPAPAPASEHAALEPEASSELKIETVEETIEPAAAAVEDEIDWLSDSPAAASPVTSPKAEPAIEMEAEVEELFFDTPASEEPELAPPAVDAASDSAEAKVEDEIDWLTADAPATDIEPLSEDEFAGFGDAMLAPPVEEAEAVTEELSFDEAPLAENAAAPVIEPVAETPTKPPKAKKGLWPFGRKKKAEAAAAQAESLEDTHDDAVPFSSDETVVMEPSGASAAPNPAEEVEAAALSFDEEPAEVAEIAFDEPEATALPAEEVAEAAPAPEKPKRGFFSFGRKKKAPAEAQEPAVEDVVPAAEPVAEEVAAVEEAAPAEAPAKKRGWFSFGKKPKAPAAEAVNPPAPEAEPPRAAPPTPKGATPSPESFEFSDAELEEITAETAPVKPNTPADAQALAADEVLDFELDLPLDDAAPSIEPVVSDEPTPTTGADDDDFLDFLAEELPGAKPKRGG